MSTHTFGPSALATPANAVTLVRILFLPVLIVMIVDDAGWAALALWIVLATSDLFDGWLARRHGATRSGAFLDPLADKIVVLSAMAALVSVNRMWWAPVALIGVREVAVSAYRSYVGRRGVSVPARPWAKVKTVFQDVAVGLALIPATSDGYRGLVAAVLWVTVGLTLATGAQYLWDGRRVVRPNAV